MNDNQEETMKNYIVTMIAHFESNKTETIRLNVEAGNKKTAYLRAMTEIHKDPKYKDIFMSLDKVEEIRKAVI
jgi:UV DNA damage repair endonuclease